MTKEELAKKKGIKLNQNNQTAAESIIMSQIEKKEVEKKENKTKEISPQIKKTTNEEKKISDDITRVGRPKGVPSTKISLNVPNDYLEFINIAACINYKGNTSSYIVELIKKDINENGKIYEQIKKLAN